MTSARLSVGFVFLLLAAGLAAYHNSFSAPFVFDDLSSIVGNEKLRQPWSLGPFLMESSRPVLDLTLALNYGWGGLDVFGYHAVNLGIHLCAALLLFGLLRRTLQIRWMALSAALLWMLHPLQTQAVTYIAQRAESLMGLFYLLTLAASLRAFESKRPAGWTALAILSAVLGAGTKAGIATVPVAVLLYDRSFLFRSWREALAHRKAFYLGLFASWIALIWPVWKALQADAQTVGLGLKSLNPITYAAAQPGVVLHYLRLSVFPHPLVFDYAWQPAASVWQVLWTGLPLAALLAGSLWFWRKEPRLGFWALWPFLMLAPTSSLVPVADLAVEHRMYLPLAGVITLGVLAGRGLLERLIRDKRLRRLAAAGVVLALAAGLGRLTFRRNQDYRSPLSLWSDTLAKRPLNPRAHAQVGKLLALQGETDRAIAHLEQALQLKPDFLAAHNNLGNVLAEQGKLSEAMAQYQEALRVHPDFAATHSNIGNVLFKQGQLSEAAASYRRALELDPHLAQTHLNLGLLLQQQGRLAEAATHYEAVLRLQPDHEKARSFLQQVKTRMESP